MRRVVVTGIAPIGSNYVGKEEFWDVLINKRIDIHKIPTQFEKNYTFKSRYFVPAPVIAEQINPAMGENAKIAVTAARLAIEDSGLKNCEVENYRDFAVIIGVGIGYLKTSFDSHYAHVSCEGRFNRMVLPMTMCNSVSAWVCIDLGITGFSHTINTACSSGNAAIGEAFHAIKSGRVNGVLAGGVECLDDESGATMRAFDVLTTLTTSADGLPRPFSRGRSGFLFNFGAGCILVLEELETAKKRGANIYAEIIDYAQNSEAYSIAQMEKSGEKVAKLFEIIKDKKIDYVNAHGTGTIQNDEVEAAVLQKVFGNSLPVINSTKGILGHSIGASAALEVAAVLLSIQKRKIHGNVTNNAIIDLPTDPVDIDITYAISTSYGFGGHNTLLLIGGYDG